MGNLFEKFCTSYLDYLNKLSVEFGIGFEDFATKSIVKEDNLFYFLDFKKIEIGEISIKLKELYNEIFSSNLVIYNEVTRAKWFQTILDYANFLRYAEKCFFYKNSESLKLYSEIMDKATNLYYRKDGYKIKISFEHSKIETEDSTIFDKKYHDFITIEVARDYGKQMKNTFSFISGEEPILNNPSDAILFNKIQRDICYAITESFDKIMTSIVPCLTDNHTEIYWKEVVTDGLWIRRSLFK